MGHIIKIKLVDDIEECGFAKYDENEILLNKNNIPSAMEHTLCHELIHFILYYMNIPKLRDDEHFVDVFAGLLHQSLKSSGIWDK